jgi:competence protein ComEC
VLIADARPDVALISVGRSNRYGHPSPAVLSRLSRAGVRVHRTDREGAVTVLGRDDGTFTVMGERAASP